MALVASAMSADAAAGRLTSVGAVVREHARARPESIAFQFEGATISFGEFDRKANQMAHALAERGLRMGDRVTYLGKNTIAYFIMLIGASRIGVVSAPINWRLAVPEIAHILRDAEATILFVGSEFEAAAKAAADQDTRITTFVAVENDITGFERFDDVLAGQSDRNPDHVAQIGDPLVQLYTSGTTGLPKGVVLAHRALIEQRYDVRDAGVEWGAWDASDISLLAMPVFHISGTGWGNYGLFAGAKSIIAREFDPAKVLDFIETEKVSRLFLVPAALKILIDDPRSQTVDYSHVRGVNYGSSPISEDLLARALALIGPIFNQHYGLTETTGSVLALEAADHDPPGNPRLRSCGRAIVGSEVRIVDPEGQPVPFGTAGEIQIRSSSNMLHYWKQPEATAKTLTPDNWLFTGDAAWMDADGYVYILDRIKDMIISGGENIYPIEVENALSGHPAVDEVAVIGVPDQRWGEAVCAVIVLRAGVAADPAALSAWARERIAGYKVPKSYDFVTAMPRNSAGKILRRELRAAAWTQRDRQVN